MTGRTSAAITAIVPTYNRAEYLREALDGILAQTRPPECVIVVDDGSTDATPSLLDAYGNRIVRLRRANGGKAAALNHALRHADGDTVWIFDDDDVPLPNALATLNATLDAEPNADFAFGRHAELMVDPDGTRTIAHPEPGRFDSDDLFCALLERCFVFQGGMLVRRRAYDAAGPFDETMTRAQDYEMLVRLAHKGTGVGVSDIIFLQRRHQGRRGTASDQISGAEVWERQKDFDALVLRRTRDRVPLHDYLPVGDRNPAPGDQHAANMRGLLRRGAVMARKRLWDFAIDDVDTACRLADAERIGDVPPREAAMLRRVFDEFGYAQDWHDADNPLLAAMAAHRNRFGRSVFAALAWPAFRQTIRPATHGELGRAFRNGRRYVKITRGGCLTEHARQFAKRYR